MKQPNFGTWATSRDAVPDGFTQITVYAEESGERVATVFDADAARLIAAAPALYEALADLRTTAKRINNRQHAGIKIDALSWSQLYDSCNAADAALALVESEDA